MEHVRLPGLATTLVLIAFSPAVSGSATSMLPHSDFHWFPLSNPGIVTVPLGFLLGILGTLSSRKPDDPGKASEMAVRVVTSIDLKDSNRESVTAAAL